MKLGSDKQIIQGFSRKTGITDPKVDTFIEMQDEVLGNDNHDFMKMEIPIIWNKSTTIYGMDFGMDRELVSWWKTFAERAAEDRTKYFDGKWEQAQPDDKTNGKLKLEHQRKFSDHVLDDLFES